MKETNKYTKSQYISEMFVICPDHHADGLTSKTEHNINILSEDARRIIAQVKLHEKESLRSEICLNFSLNTSNDKDQSNTTSEMDSKALRVENDLLKQLNSELVSNNNFMRGLIESKEKSNKTFVQAVTTKNVIPPNIIIKSKNNNNKTSLDSVKKEIDSKYLNINKHDKN